MKRVRTLLPFVLLVVLITPSCWAQSPQKVLLISRLGGSDVDLYFVREVQPMIALLESAGYQVVVASENAQTTQGVSRSLKADADLSSIRMSDFRGVLLPCLGTHGVPIAAIRAVKQASSEGIVIAAGDGGVLVLGEAGLLKGRRFAATKSHVGYFIDGT